MIEINDSVTELNTDKDGVVVSVTTEHLLTGKYFNAVATVETKVPWKSPSDSDFIEFNKLTEYEVIKWTYSVNQEKVNSEIEKAKIRLVKSEKAHEDALLEDQSEPVQQTFSEEHLPWKKANDWPEPPE